MKHANDNFPIALTRSQAAGMLGLTPSGFDVWVRKGIAPPPIAGTRRWSRVALERAISGTAIDVELDPFEQWEAENVRKVQGR